MVNAVVEAQKPSVVQFIADEGIPFLASIGGSDVARELQEKSVLARSTANLGGGLKGLQGLAGLVASPGKKSGIGDLMQYLPLIQQFMSAQGGGNSPESQSHSRPPSNGGGGRIGGT